MNYGYGQVPKERLRLKMTNEERGYFSSLLEFADKDLSGKLEGKTAANFLKKSGLSKEILKQIWLIAAQTDPTFLEKDEFYIALRLVALAQNHMEYSEESIRLNHPLPPLPKFDLKGDQQSISDMSSMTMGSMNKNQPSYGESMNAGNQNASMYSNIPSNTDPNMNPSISSMNQADSGMNRMPMMTLESFIISPNEEERYNQIFESNKDKDGYINPFKATQLWFNSNVPNEIIHKIMSMVPFKNSDSMTNKEFNVCTHLVSKSFKSEIPAVLPTVLKEYLGILDGSPMEQRSIDKLSSIHPINSNITNVSIDMESVLLKEFNIKQSAKTEMKPNMQRYKGVAAVGVVPGVKNLLEQLKEMEKDSQNENDALTKELEDSLALLSSFNDDIEKVNKIVNDLNRKNQMIKDEITDYRRRINIEKDNMVKLSVNMKLLKDEVGGA